MAFAFGLWSSDTIWYIVLTRSHPSWWVVSGERSGWSTEGTASRSAGTWHGRDTNARGAGRPGGEGRGRWTEVGQTVMSKERSIGKEGGCTEAWSLVAHHPMHCIVKSRRLQIRTHCQRSRRHDIPALLPNDKHTQVSTTTHTLKCIIKHRTVGWTDGPTMLSTARMKLGIRSCTSCVTNLQSRR